MFGERLNRARSASGLSQAALGKATGVSANMIKKYEHNESMPSSSVMIRLSKTLDVRAEYFFRPVKVELKNVEYRKRSSTPKKVLNRIHADVLDQAERWLQLANLWPNFPIKRFNPPASLPDEIFGIEDMEAFSELVRSEWELGLNPIPDLIDLFESKGILVISTDVEIDAKFDGLQAEINGQPVIVISSLWSGDRQRFTLAHELGHILVHERLANNLDEEKVCNRFASSFLLPQKAFVEHFGEKRYDLEARELYLLKHEFGLSMGACLYRAKDLGVIADSLYKKLTISFAKKGWRKREPGEQLPPEKTFLFEQLVYRGLSDGILSESKAAELMSISLMEFHQQRKLEDQGSLSANSH
ncbi:transcriptional regulator [Hydrogenovibrio crunogenus]|uniref:Transcriptional regulator n=1 Tax=Hydrogenovibrio crunogenus TaxID=39765 RepID=A0A4P7NXA7_9GAMM|nr:XRE family transcriptional regulator [Hydrogenovibrio crunogenus]QBZ82373.1 transcriptional regulator [Hydrogenovibrio crunogenus]